MPDISTIRVILPQPERVTIDVSEIGFPGPPGVGVPVGGTTGQVLAKIDNTSYNTHWVTGSGGAAWGSITGTLSDQTDLNTALNGKVPTSRLISTTAPLTGGGDLSANRTLSIISAALTKTDDTNVTLALGGTPATALLQATSLTLGWTGTLAVARGGTGAATSSAHTFFANNTSGVAAPSFTSFVAGTDYEVPLTASKSITRTTNDFTLTNDSATPGNSKYYGTDSGGTRGYFALPAGATGANPTASVGLTVVNGVLTTFMRSDAAPPLDVTISPNWSGNHSFTAGSIVVTTQSASDNSTKAASTAYVTTAISNAIAGVNPAVAVQAATTAASDTSGLTYNNGVGGIGATLTGSNNTPIVFDGYTFTAVGQRGLVKNDTQSPSGAFNGVYYITQIQTAILPPILTRALDYDMPSDINNTGAIPVVNGTVNGTTSWVLTSTVTTVGTDPLTFTEFSLNPTTLVTTSRTLTIGGTAQDLSADRSWLASTTALPEGTNLYYTDARVRLNRLDQMAAPTADVSMNSHKITNLSDATLNQDAVTYSQLLSSAGGGGSGAGLVPITRQDYTIPITLTDTSLLLQPTRLKLGAVTVAGDNLKAQGTGRLTVFDQANNPYQKGAYNQPPMVIRSGEFVQQYSELQMNGNERATFTEDGRLIVFSSLGASVGADPTSNIGLSAVVGSAATFMRSDAAPALSQAIVPTWTGLHAWKISDATTGALNILTIGHNTSSSTGGLGAAILFQAQDSTTTDQDQARIYSDWSSNAHNSVSSSLQFQTRSSGVALATKMVLSGAGGLDVGAGASESGAVGVINAGVGFTVGQSAATGFILQGNGTNYIVSGAAWPTGLAGTGKIIIGGGSDWAAQTLSGSGATISLASTGVMTISNIANASLANAGAPITMNEYGASFSIPDTGNLNQPTRATAASTERITVAGTGRNTVFDPANSLFNLDKSFLSPPSFILRDGEFVVQAGRTALTGNKRATMTETGRLIGADFPASISRLILAGSSQNNN